MTNIFYVLLGLSLIAVFAVMLLGIVSMLKGGKFNEKYGNRLMQARVYLQGLALVLLVAAFFSSGS